MTSSFYSLVMF